jgi:hypothetical protein
MPRHKITSITIVLSASILLGGCYTTPLSIGTSPFKAATEACSSHPAGVGNCLASHPNRSAFTQAEREMAAYMSYIHQAVKQGQISLAEANILQEQYMTNSMMRGQMAERQRALDTSAALAQAGNAMSTYAAQQQAINAAYRPRQTTCVRNGAFMNCTTY